MRTNKVLDKPKGLGYYLIMMKQTDTDTKAELRRQVETLAAQAGQTPLQVISALQAATATTDNTELLDALCELKWEYI